jgi:hypothetical protein
MCCFSGPVERVSNTNLFARKSGSDKQLLVYQMQIRTKIPVAMILPLPVEEKSRENAVRFISLSNYPDFFSDLASGFRLPQHFTPPPYGGAGLSMGVPSLPVVNVGDFIASYVPSLKDFKRLDTQFALPPNTWESLPEYSDYGFAVFQLNMNKGEDMMIHPMALEFTTRLKNTLFFPTVHIHDGKIHSSEMFDHTLYLQTNHIGKLQYPNIKSSYQFASYFVKNPTVNDIIISNNFIHRLSLKEFLPNKDTLIQSNRFI